MKSRRLHFLLLLFLMFLVSIRPFEAQINTEWSSEIKTDSSYKWKAENSELRDLTNDEQYSERELIGGSNIPNGGTKITLTSSLTENFVFLNGDRLDLSITVEGDMVITSEFDYHLALLPLKSNGTNFFSLLIDNRTVLENLTKSTFLSSEIDNKIAFVKLKYNDHLNVTYEWDITTGILQKKEVTSVSGKRLTVVPGKGIGFGANGFNIIPGFRYQELFSIFAIIIPLLVFRKINR